MFFHQRTLHNGANSNPTYLGYCHSVNSVTLGQASISWKSNVGGGEGTQLPVPNGEKSKVWNIAVRKNLFEKKNQNEIVHK